MGVIPRQIYRTIEWQLHNAEDAARRCREQLQDVLDRAQPGGSIAGNGKGPPGDRTGKTAVLLCEKAQDIAEQEQWLLCIRLTREYFRGSVTGQVADQYYGRNVTILQVAEQMHYDKQSINRYRDRYVSFLALLASSRGLIRLAAWAEERT